MSRTCLLLCLLHFRTLAVVEVLEKEPIERRDETAELSLVPRLCPSGQLSVGQHVLYGDGHRSVGTYAAPFRQEAVGFPNPVQVGEKYGGRFLKRWGLLPDPPLSVEFLKPLVVLSRLLWLERPLQELDQFPSASASAFSRKVSRSEAA